MQQYAQGLNKQQIQMDLLSEERTPSETLQYALARQRGQEIKCKSVFFLEVHHLYECFNCKSL